MFAKLVKHINAFFVEAKTPRTYVSKVCPMCPINMNCRNRRSNLQHLFINGCFLPMMNQIFTDRKWLEFTNFIQLSIISIRLKNGWFAGSQVPKTVLKTNESHFELVGAHLVLVSTSMNQGTPENVMAVLPQVLLRGNLNVLQLANKH